jgi:ornithine carbamoyltransferase
LIALYAPGAEVQAVGVQVHQRHARIQGGEIDFIQKVTAAHAHIQMIVADVLLIMGQQDRRRAAPQPATGQPQNSHIIKSENKRAVNSLASVSIILVHVHLRF